MGLNERLVNEAESMLRDGFVEGLEQHLRGKFPTLRDEAAAAIGHGVEKLITRPAGREPRDARAYLVTTAYNQMKHEAKLRARHKSLDALRDDDDGEFEPADPGWTVEERALISDVYRELRSIVETWETGHVRVVTLLYLEAAYVGEPLPSSEAAENVGSILGESIDSDFIRTWKSRGYRRLRRHVEQLAAAASDTEVARE